MITFVRKLTAPVMVFLLVVVGISFVFFGNWTSKGAATGPIGKINGQNVYPEEFLSAQKAAEVAYAFRTGREFDRNSYGDDFLFSQTWGRLLILSEAHKSGLVATDEQVLNAIKSSPLFQENGAFSTVYFQRFVQNYLNPRGVSSELFEQIIRDELTIGSLLEGLSKTAVVRPDEVETAYNQLFGKIDVQIINLQAAKIKSTIKPTDGEIKVYYEKNSSRYVRPEKRKFDYITFILPEKEQKLPEKEKNKALEALGKKAFAFTGKFLSVDEKAPKPDFGSEARKDGLSVQSTDLVSLDNPSSAVIFKRSQVLNAGFDLTKENPVSDYLPIENGFVVLSLKDIKPSETIPLNEVLKQVTEDFLEEQSHSLLVEKGKQLRSDIAAKIASGIPFEKAAVDAGEKAETLPSFIPAEARKISAPGANVIVYLAQRLKAGEVSTFETFGTGGVIVYLKGRTEPDAKNREKILPMIERDIYEGRRQQMVNDWLVAKLNSSGNKTPSKLAASLQGEQ